IRLATWRQSFGRFDRFCGGFRMPARRPGACCKLSDGAGIRNSSHEQACPCLPGTAEAPHKALTYHCCSLQPTLLIAWAVLLAGSRNIFQTLGACSTRSRFRMRRNSVGKMGKESPRKLWKEILSHFYLTH